MKGHIKISRPFEIGEVDRRFAGSFVEHLNRCMYGGLYEKDHAAADQNGFRGDVKQLIQKAGVSLLRYPGGNFVSSYDWKKGIGPREKRKPVYEPAWQTIEKNEVGIDEFAAYARELGCELALSVNMGTGTPMEAAELVEYCNLQGGTQYSELRKENGAEEPYHIRLWCVGNEMDGPWQMGSLDAKAYGAKFRETSKLMRAVDPEIELIACGSCSNEEGHNTFGFWDRQVLEEAYDQIDYLSLHRYYGYDVERELLYPRKETIRDGAAMPADFDDMLTTVESAIRYVKGIRRSGHEVYLAIDELNLIPKRIYDSNGDICDVFSQYEAVLYGGLLCVLLNHADRVKIHCQSLLVNENGLITTVRGKDAFAQAIFYPFRDAADCIGGRVLLQNAVWDTVETEHFGRKNCGISACVYAEENKTLKVLAANFSLEEELELSIDVEDFGQVVCLGRTELYLKDYTAGNTEKEPEKVVPVYYKDEGKRNSDREGNTLSFLLRPHSWNVITLKTEW